MYTKLIGKGREAEVYRMDEKRILKLFFHNVPNNIVQRELAISKELNNYSLPIPKFYGIQNEDGRLGLIYEYVKGDLLMSLMIKNPFKISNYICKFSLIHKQLHEVPSPDIPNLEEKLRFDIENQLIINKKQTNKLLVNLNALCKEDKVLLHWDYHPANVIISSGDYFVIDWTGASVGPRLADVARTYMLFKYSYIDSIPQILNKAIQPIKDKLADNYLSSYFGNKDGIDLVTTWLPIVAAARLSENITDYEKDTLLRLINS